MPQRLLVIVLAAAGLLAVVFFAIDTASTGPGASLPAAGAGGSATLSADRSAVIPPVPDAEDEELAGDEELEVTPLVSTESRAQASTEADAYEEELAEALWVEGRLIYPADTPADERVFVVADGSDFEHGPEHRVEVPPDGSFRVAFAKRTIWGTLELEARYLYLEEGVRLDFRETVPALVLEPKLGGRIHGELRLAIGEATRLDDLGEASVELERTALSGNSPTPGTFRAAPIQGPAFEFDAIPLGAEYEVSLDAENGYGRQVGDISIVAGETSEIVLEIRTGVAVEGRVIDEQAMSVPEVDVTVNSRDFGGVFGWRRATTGSDGAFSVRGLPPGKLTIEVEAEGFAPAERELLPAAEGETIQGVEVILTRGLQITGRVRWPDGTPASGATIELERSDSRPDRFATTIQAGDDGSFAAGGLPEGSFQIRAWTTEEAPVKSSHTGKEHRVLERSNWKATAEDVAAGTSGLDLVLDPGALVSGLVSDDLGRLLDAFQVEALPVEGSRSFHLPHFHRFSMDGVRQSFKGTAGRFELEVGPGRWSIAAKADGHGASEGHVLRVPDDLAQAIELVVPRAARIEGVVVDSSGRGVANAQVVLPEEDRPFFLDEGSVVTDRAGGFVLEEVAPGAVAIQALSDHAAPSERAVVEVAPGELVSGLVLSLRLGGRITGQVVDARGDGLPGREVDLFGFGQLFGQSVLEATTDATGHFAFENLAAGQYHLMSSPTPEELAQFALHASEELDQILKRQAKVELEERGSASVILAPPLVRPVRIHGRVTASGVPLPGASLWMHNVAVFARNEAGADGTYELTVPSPGQYRIGVRSERTGMQATVEIEVPEVDRFAFDIEIATGRISGSVVDPDGRPLADIEVTAALVGRSEERVGGRTTTGRDGSFRLEVPAGTHDVAAGVHRPRSEVPAGFAPEWVRGITVAQGSAVSGVDIRLRPGGSIDGTVELQDGGSLSTAWVAAVDGEGNEVGETMADVAGSFRLEGVPPGRMRVQAFDREQRVSASTAVDVRVGETARVTLALSKGTTLRARVADASGTIEVEAVELLDAAGEVIATGSREEDGTYELGSVPSGKHVVRARHLGKSCQQEVDVAGGGELTVELLVE